MSNSFFPPKTEINPIIYGYTELSSEYEGLIKIGRTDRTIEQRMKEHYPTKGPNGFKRYKVLFTESRLRTDGTDFTDDDVRKYLSERGITKRGGEWMECSVEEAIAGVLSVRERQDFNLNRTETFKPRPEQMAAIAKTSNYFKNYNSIEGRTPHFLWNCKMRFGKTFTTYKLAQNMGWNKLLVLTFKPAVENSWKEDLYSHIDFEGWQFISRTGTQYEEINKSKPFVCFASFQDFLGKNDLGGIKVKNQWAHKVEWD